MELNKVLLYIDFLKCSKLLVKGRGFNNLCTAAFFFDTGVNIPRIFHT